MQNKNLIRGLNTRWGDIKLHTMLILDTISFALIAEDNLDMRSSEDLILKLQWKFFNSHLKKKTRKQYPIKDTKFCYWEFWVTWYMILISFLRLQNGWWSKLLYKINEKSRQFTDEWKYDLRKKLQLNNKLGKNQ